MGDRWQSKAFQSRAADYGFGEATRDLLVIDGQMAHLEKKCADQESLIKNAERFEAEQQQRINLLTETVELQKQCIESLKIHNETLKESDSLARDGNLSLARQIEGLEKGELEKDLAASDMELKMVLHKDGG